MEHLCEECGSQLAETNTHYVCPSCGLVQGPRYVEGNYQTLKTAMSFGNRFVEAGEKPTSVGMGTFIDYYGSWRLSDIAGKKIGQETGQRFARLKRINDVYTQSRGKDKLYRALQLLNRISGSLELPHNLREESARIYRRAYQEIESKARIATVVAACIYLATRLINYNLRVKEILKAFEQQQLALSGKSLITAAAEIRRVLGLKVRATRPEEYLERAVISLVNNQNFKIRLQKNHIGEHEYTIQSRKLAKQILKHLDQSKRGGRDPYILASACLAGADLIIAKNFGKRRGVATQRLVAEACEIPEYTLREHFLRVVKPILKDITRM